MEKDNIWDRFTEKIPIVIIATVIVAFGFGGMLEYIEWYNEQVEINKVNWARTSIIETIQDGMLCSPKINETTEVIFWDHTYIFGRVAAAPIVHPNHRDFGFITFADGKQKWLRSELPGESFIALNSTWEIGKVHRIKLRSVPDVLRSPAEHVIRRASDVQVIKASQCPGI
ncbi:MAG: hypothetical protein ABH919_02295 [bacterium]